MQIGCLFEPYTQSQKGCQISHCQKDARSHYGLKKDARSHYGLKKDAQSHGLISCAAVLRFQTGSGGGGVQSWPTEPAAPLEAADCPAGRMQARRYTTSDSQITFEKIDVAKYDRMLGDTESILSSGFLALLRFVWHAAELSSSSFNDE